MKYELIIPKPNGTIGIVLLTRFVLQVGYPQRNITLRLLNRVAQPPGSIMMVWVEKSEARPKDFKDKLLRIAQSMMASVGSRVQLMIIIKVRIYPNGPAQSMMI